MKILIIQQKMIGDVLTSSILFEALKKKFPNWQLHYLIQPHTAAVVENNPFIDEILLFDPAKYGGVSGLVEFSKKVRKENYNLVIDIYALISSAFITAFSGAKKRISYHKWYTSKAYTHTISLKKEPKTNAGLAIENRMLLLQEISTDFPIQIKPKIYLTDAEKALAKRKLAEAGISEDKPLFMISILGSSSQKTYPLKYMAQVLDFLVAESQPQLLFNYIPKKEKEAKILLSLCAPATQKAVFFNVFGKSLREFIALTSQCDALIGNEGGAVNMAKAVEIPTFSIFSPHIKKKSWGIYEDGKQQVSVHLKDFKSELFNGKLKKELLKQNPHLYDCFHPGLIFAALKNFLSWNLAHKHSKKK